MKTRQAIVKAINDTKAQYKTKPELDALDLLTVTMSEQLFYKTNNFDKESFLKDCGHNG